MGRILEIIRTKENETNSRVEQDIKAVLNEGISICKPSHPPSNITDSERRVWQLGVNEYEERLKREINKL